MWCDFNRVLDLTWSFGNNTGTVIIESKHFVFVFNYNNNNNNGNFIDFLSKYNRTSH